MYLKDPTKRVQYTFRIKEELMDNLKVYAKAKDVKIPRLLNDIIEESMEGMNFSNTWLNEPLGAIINIPNHMPVIYNTNVLLHGSDGLPYEVKAMPVNLDTWNDKHGYIANTKGIKHKGVEPLLIPSLIKDIELKNDLDTTHAIGQCLIALDFTKLDNGRLHVELISHNRATGQLQFVNPELAKIYIHHRKVLNNIIDDNLNMLNDVNHDKVQQQLLDELEDLALTINTGNVTPIIAAPGSDNTLQSDNPYLDGSKKIVWDKVPLKFKSGFVDEMGNIYEDMQKRIDELERENQEYKNRFEQMQNDLNDMELRQKVWEEIKQENEDMHKQLNKVDDVLKRLDELERKRGERE